MFDPRDVVPLMFDGSPFYQDEEGTALSRQQAEDLLSDPDRRQVNLTDVGPYQVSTIFLVIRSYSGCLYETAVRVRDAREGEPRYRPEQVRYHTRPEAEVGHHQMVNHIKAELRLLDFLLTDVDAKTDDAS
jgi:hypothetical protein